MNQKRFEIDGIIYYFEKMTATKIVLLHCLISLIETIKTGAASQIDLGL